MKTLCATLLILALPALAPAQCKCQPDKKCPPAKAKAKAEVKKDCTVTIYTAQGLGNLPRRSHTFAIYTCGKESFCISWLPASLSIQIGSGPCDGVNLTLEATLEWCKKHKLKVRTWPARTITFEQWNAACQRKKDLDGKKFKYQVIPGKGSCNCTSAVVGYRTIIHGHRAGVIFSPRTTPGRPPAHVAPRHHKGACPCGPDCQCPGCQCP
jgi:hypothetical protein